MRDEYLLAHIERLKINKQTMQLLRTFLLNLASLLSFLLEHTSAFFSITSTVALFLFRCFCRGTHSRLWCWLQRKHVYICFRQHSSQKTMRLVSVMLASYVRSPAHILLSCALVLRFCVFRPFEQPKTKGNKRERKKKEVREPRSTLSSSAFLTFFFFSTLRRFSVYYLYSPFGVSNIETWEAVPCP